MRCFIPSSQWSASRLTANTELGHEGDVWLQGWWHRVWERRPIKFTVMTLIAVVIAFAVLAFWPGFGRCSRPRTARAGRACTRTITST